MTAAPGGAVDRSDASGARVRIDRELCLSSQTCVRHLPQVFEIDDEGVAAVLPAVRDADVGDLVEAARGCPVGAIAVFDEAGEPLDID